jgi:hypothetical protein
MRRLTSVPRRVVVLLGLGILAAPSLARAQQHKLKVVSNDSVPIPYAFVQVNGNLGLITNENGEVSISGKKATLNVTVRRIGYQPWSGKLTLADAGLVQMVVLPRIAQALGTVVVTGRGSVAPGLKGFYDRWEQRQKGTLSATFIGPEEIEMRHPGSTSDLLYGVNGVSFVHTAGGGMVARGIGGTCFMTVMLDGHRLCPDAGCNTSGGGTPGAGTEGAVGIGIAPMPAASNANMPSASDSHVVDINKYIDANDVAAIEVYARGGNTPISMQVDDNACGVIAIWTGSRKP